MNAMKLALFGSTGAPLMSAFHQLSGGKSGSGVGSAPPTVAVKRRIAKKGTSRKLRRPCREFCDRLHGRFEFEQPTPKSKRSLPNKRSISAPFGFDRQANPNMGDVGGHGGGGKASATR